MPLCCHIETCWPVGCMQADDWLGYTSANIYLKPRVLLQLVTIIHSVDYENTLVPVFEID